MIFNVAGRSIDRPKQKALSMRAVILIVDDHPETLRLCQEALQKEGHLVNTAASLNGAEQELRANPPDLVILDAALANGDPAAFCLRLQRTLSVPLLATFPPRMPPERINQFPAHSDARLQKPFAIDELCRRVRALVETGTGAGASNLAEESAAWQRASPEQLASGLATDGPSAFAITEIAGCKIERILGRGSMGTVCLGRHLLLDVPVAIKLVYAPGAGWSSADLQRFVRGAKAAARVQHPNVVPLLNAGKEGTFYYLVQRYVEGITLADEISHRATLDAPFVTAIMRDIASGLGALHAAGVIHRDVKPSNIIINGEGRAVLTDFGLARPTAGADISSDSEVLGTPFYMAPEQCQAEEVDARADLYALGVTAYHALAGRLPITGSTPLEVLRGHVERAPVPLAETAPGTPPALAQIVMQLLAKSPADRLPSAEALLEAISALPLE